MPHDRLQKEESIEEAGMREGQVSPTKSYGKLVGSLFGNVAAGVLQLGASCAMSNTYNRRLHPIAEVIHHAE
jgi:hypothetical protein